jgi:mono/diheme cytochrome c family protein
MENRATRAWLILSMMGMVACTNEPAVDSVTAYGGRLFDKWYQETGSDFVPDNPDTVEADGQGGPNGDGTLNDRDGNPALNSGHNYRFKSLFGWDLLANSGIYGEAYQAKEYVLSTGPGNDAEPPEVWIDRIENGWNDLPAFGPVLTRSQISALVDFMLAMRDGIIPGPGDLWDLSADSPKGFVMKSGGDAERGHIYYEQNCAACHGTDAADILFDDGTQTLGQHARYYGYAVAIITMNGEPGSEMGPQLVPGRGKAQYVQNLLDLIAALCDRGRYGTGRATDPDVPDADIRCGEYLR